MNPAPRQRSRPARPSTRRQRPRIGSRGPAATSWTRSPPTARPAGASPTSPTPNSAAWSARSRVPGPARRAAAGSPGPSRRCARAGSERAASRRAASIEPRCPRQPDQTRVAASSSSTGPSPRPTCRCSARACARSWHGDQADVVVDVRTLAADAVTIEALARLQLTARRLGRRISLRRASPGPRPARVVRRPRRRAPHPDRIRASLFDARDGPGLNGDSPGCALAQEAGHEAARCGARARRTGRGP